MIEPTITLALCLLWYIVSLVIINHIESRIFFIRRMRAKYDILISIKDNRGLNEKIFNIGGFAVLLLVLSPSILIYPIIYATNKIIFICMIVFTIIFIIYNIYKYNKYDILEYINYYSYDLFDWDKIYEMNIDENTKRECFLIHNLDYDNYKGRN